MQFFNKPNLTGTFGAVLLLVGLMFVSASLLAKAPPHVDPDTYGIDPKTGKFVHPEATPYYAYMGRKPVKGQMEELEDRQYIQNMKIEGHWDIVVKPGHSWQYIIDMDGRRYMFHYYRTVLKIYDITEPHKLEVILDKKYDDGNWFGAMAVAYNENLGKWIMLQSFEVPRSIGGLKGKKYSSPEAVKRIKYAEAFRGVRVYELTSITEWKQIAEISTDTLNPNGKVHQGSGALDVPFYQGGKYAFVAAAPDNTFVNIEYPNYIYSPAQMILDVEDPYNPRWVSTWWVQGQRLGEEEAYRQWRQYGNKTSWTGARLPITLPTPIEEGGKYGYTAMGGLGVHILDLSDPSNPTAVGSVDLPLNVGGVEGDNIDISRAETRGFVMASGYPMNEDCYEPQKDIYVIDVKDKTAPKIIGMLPRPMPPAEAPYSDYCLRRGKFGPKRPPAPYAPGVPDPNLTIYPYNNAGVQLFDITDPLNAEIVAFFVPKLTDNLNDPTSYNTPVESIFVEWDRNLIWVFANSGIYLLSSDAMGKANLGPVTSD